MQWEDPCGKFGYAFVLFERGDCEYAALCTLIHMCAFRSTLVFPGML